MSFKFIPTLIASSKILPATTANFSFPASEFKYSLTFAVLGSSLSFGEKSCLETFPIALAIGPTKVEEIFSSIFPSPFKFLGLTTVIPFILADFVASPSGNLTPCLLKNFELKLGWWWL